MVNPNTFALASWWSELNHFGQTLHAGHAPKLSLADPPAKAWTTLAAALPDFRAWTELGASKREKDLDPLHRWLDAVLEGFLGHSPQDFLKHTAVGDGWKVVGPDGRALKPERLLRLNPPEEDHALPIFITSSPLGQKDGKRRALDLDRFLRAKQLPMGILTDGRSLRWVVAGTHQNAFTQWDLLAGWGEGEARQPWRGLYTLFGHSQGWKATPGEDRPHRLGLWIQESGQMQGDLSTSLGEQIREAVETLVHALDRWSMDDPARLLPLVELEPDPGKQNHALYTASVRLVMRLVVIAFAESRGLLPVTQDAYRESYGLEVLWQRLKRAKGEVGFDHQRSAWVQLLGLFRLVHDGSAHPDLNLRAYGGDLFHPGRPDSPDPIQRALAFWESVDGVPVTDRDVLHVLDRLKRTTVRVNGKAVATPVDFSTLSTEYIGLLYEGLLDYDLRTAAEPMLLLNLGQQPLLPLSLLKAKNDKETKELLETLAKEKATKASSDAGEEGDDESEDEEEDAPESEPEAAAEDEALVAEEPETEEVASGELTSEAWAWAAEAARIMPSRFGLGNLRRGQTKAQKPDDMDSQDWADKLQRAARSLVARVIPKGERFLIRWSGTRKGSGTFYTRPSLTEPLIRETLRPLCFEADGTPKTPEAILSLKVLDPAMGSASFLVGALRYLTHALYDSLIHHRFRVDRPDRVVLTLPFGLPALGSPGESLPPIHPDDPDAEPKLKRRLKRFVVERCLYGVDINPLAVELAKLAMWVETLDPDLPFGFLDHKFRCGNGLVGCWLDRVDDYPIRAWDREGGDGKDGKETKALKDAFNAAKAGQADRISAGGAWVVTPDHQAPEEVLPAARKALETLHAIPIHEVDRQREAWNTLKMDPALTALRQALDRWCALFFWPGVDEAGNPLKSESMPMPGSWRNSTFIPMVQRIAARHRFLHWELAFPEVFTGPESGFDVVLGNPPWEVAKPNSNEFFTAFDPIFRTYKKNKADEAKTRLFAAHSGMEGLWNSYLAGFKAMTGWVSAAANPFDANLARGKKGEVLAHQWATARAKRQRYSDPQRPYQRQGSADLNTYKLFLEQSRAILRKGGRLGFVVPSGLYTDAGAKDLRDTFLTQDAWELLYGFENRRKIFAIDSRFKFVVTVVTKAKPGTGDALQAAFMRLDTSELTEPKVFTLPVTPAQIRRFAPKTLSVMELRSPQDLYVAEKLYSDHPLLGDIGLSYNREFDMANDAKLWKDGSRAKLEAAGLLAPGDDTRDIRVRFRLWKEGWLPLVEGKHFWQFNPYFISNSSDTGIRRFLSQQKFIHKSTLLAVAEEKSRKSLESQINIESIKHHNILNFMPWLKPRLLFRAIANSSNARSTISTLMLPSPHGHNQPDFSINGIRDTDSCAYFNSFVIDWILRRQKTVYIQKPQIESLPFPSTISLLLKDTTFVQELIGISSPPDSDPSSRLTKKIILECIIALAFNLSYDDFEHILLSGKSGGIGFTGREPNIPLDVEIPKLTIGTYRQILSKGLGQFLREGIAFPEAAFGHDRPLVDMWAPEGGWEAAWAEARAAADSDHEWDLFLGKDYAVQAEYGSLGSISTSSHTLEKVKPLFGTEPQSGALFNADELT